jgi:hypothetical protein
MKRKSISEIREEMEKYMFSETQNRIRSNSFDASYLGKLFEVGVIFTALQKEKFFQYLNEQSTVLYEWLIERMWMYLKGEMGEDEKNRLFESLQEIG